MVVVDPVVEEPREIVVRAAFKRSLQGFRIGIEGGVQGLRVAVGDHGLLQHAFTDQLAELPPDERGFLPEVHLRACAQQWLPGIVGGGGKVRLGKRYGGRGGVEILQRNGATLLMLGPEQAAELCKPLADPDVLRWEPGLDERDHKAGCDVFRACVGRELRGQESMVRKGFALVVE